jgi:L-iditol 2-dehydrogenase
MKASGMCGSDLIRYRASGTAGAPAVIAGHEPCGVVAARGPGVSEASAPIGQRVMNHHYQGCGGCRQCRTGWTQLCPRGAVTFGMSGHGGHAPFMKVPAASLVPLPDPLSFEEGAAIACGTGTAYQALARLGVSGRDTLAVFGQGPVGLSATMLGVAMGARVLAVDVAPERRRLATAAGAEAVVDPGAGDAAAAVRALTRGEGADVVLDCAGSPEARVAAVRSARMWGRAGLVGLGGPTTFDVGPDLIGRQLTIHASWTVSSVGLGECARFVVERRVPLRDLVTHRFRLEQAAEAYELFDTQTTGKGVFVT